MYVDQTWYCKRGYFRWGKISRKCWQDISRGGNFHDTTHISFIKAGGFYFRVGVIFAMKTKARNTQKLPPRENFHVYSIKRVAHVEVRLGYCLTLYQRWSMLRGLTLLIFSAPEPKAHVHYCDHALSVVRPSVVNFSHFRLLL